MPNLRRWPTDEELAQLELDELELAEDEDRPEDPICDCGWPGYSCHCEEIAYNVGYWFDGSTYDY
jgi:hypothetical protein